MCSEQLEMTCSFSLTVVRYRRVAQTTRRANALGSSVELAGRIGNVLPNSPAQQAGIRPGDRIVRYDGERVFSMMDVANHIMRGEPEGNVVVDIMRGEVPMQLVIPRGPLGVMGD